MCQVNFKKIQTYVVLLIKMKIWKNKHFLFLTSSYISKWFKDGTEFYLLLSCIGYRGCFKAFQVGTYFVIPHFKSPQPCYFGEKGLCSQFWYVRVGSKRPKFRILQTTCMVTPIISSSGNNFPHATLKKRVFKLCSVQLKLL